MQMLMEKPIQVTKTVHSNGFNLENLNNLIIVVFCRCYEAEGAVRLKTTLRDVIQCYSTGVVQLPLTLSTFDFSGLKRCVR